ncbi:MAG: phospho-sugar mutase [Flavobacteriaceae bacterium]|nr:phospho-sugar mutase [Flavobacteriaceae bacterium]
MKKEQIIERAKPWLKEPFDADTREKVKTLIDTNSEILLDSFYTDMEFGTGGMRGIMGVGTNRINKYTLGRATQGLANYLHIVFPPKELKVAIAYDCRHNSKSLAKLVADVLTANNIKVFLFDDLRPTPELSFAVRHLGCDAGIVLTASHNPPEYNGYKVYWNDGGQIVPPHDKKIIEQVNLVQFDKINFKANDNLLAYIGKDVDKVFIDACVKNGTFNTPNRSKLKVVFTSLHGTSIMSIPDALKKAGFKDVHIVKEQRKPDGDFPTVISPNPEEPAALKMATDLAEKIGADIVIGTDPDSDRLGIAVRDLDHKIILLNGNQTMSVMSNYLIKQWHEHGRLDGNQFIGSTIVSTNLVNDIAQSYNVETKVGLTGFKWIAKMIRDAEGKQEFIGGGEESFGYMVGDFIRDKDAVTATLLACEIAIDAKNNNSTFYKELLNLYIKHGFYKEHLISLVRKGIDGAAQIKKMMTDLRNNPVKEIDSSPVEFLYDYESSICQNLITNEKTNIDLPKSNVLIYQTVDGTKVAARPSGTEPKIKFYFSVNQPLDKIENVFVVEKLLSQKIERIIEEMNLN